MYQVAILIFEKDFCVGRILTVESFDKFKIQLVQLLVGFCMEKRRVSIAGVKYLKYVEKFQVKDYICQNSNSSQEFKRIKN